MLARGCAFSHELGHRGPRGSPGGGEGPWWPLSLQDKQQPSTHSKCFADPDTYFPEKGFIQSGL